jgi:hypothetical protein
VSAQALLDGTINIPVGIADGASSDSRIKRRTGTDDDSGGGKNTQIAMSKIRQFGLSVSGGGGTALVRGDGHEVGDLRVTFKHAAPSDASVVAMQKRGGGFESYHVSNTVAGVGFR